ncbi:hypothetical protein ACLOJK_027328, partial [Asimina triloba]
QRPFPGSDDDHINHEKPSDDFIFIHGIDVESDMPRSGRTMPCWPRIGLPAPRIA